MPQRMEPVRLTFTGAARLVMKRDQNLKPLRDHKAVEAETHKEKLEAIKEMKRISNERTRATGPTAITSPAVSSPSPSASPTKAGSPLTTITRDSGNPRSPPSITAQEKRVTRKKSINSSSSNSNNSSFSSSSTSITINNNNKDSSSRSWVFIGWALSGVLMWVFGTFGLFLSMAPASSDWASPFRPLLGDAGRMHLFEAGDDGIQSKLLGGPAWFIEGTFLGLGSVGLLTSFSGSAVAQLLTVYLVPLEALCYLVKMVYFEATGAPELQVPMAVLGASLLALSVFRASVFLDRKYRAVYWSYLAWLCLTMAFAAYLIRERAGLPQFAADLDQFVAVRDHFFKVNGMKWTEGLQFPDGFKMPKAQKKKKATTERPAMSGHALLLLLVLGCTLDQYSSLRSSQCSTCIFQRQDLVLHAKKESAKSRATEDDEAGSGRMTDAKKEALSGVLYQIERSYGKGSIQKLGANTAMNVATVSSGSITLDLALGGGYPRGRVIEIYGPESSGKTTLALHAVAEFQRTGGTCAFIDAEHALDPIYARNLGCNVEDLLICQPDSGEMALDVVDQLVRSSAIDLIVVDSVAALVPRAELEGDMGDQQMGLQARLMSKALRKITGSLSKSSTTVLFINQLRSKIGVIYGNPEVTAGGNALKFYSSVRLDIRRKEVLKENTGISVRVKVVKNKVAPPFRVVEFDVLFGSGIDRWGCLLDAAESLGVIERKGSWYNRGELRFAQGRRPAAEFLKSNKLVADEVAAEVRESIAKNLAAAQAGGGAGVFDESEEDGEGEGAEDFDADFGLDGP